MLAGIFGRLKGMNNMAIPILIYGKSGSGKSRSLKNFGEDEILYVNIERKTLPFRKKFKYICTADNVDVILQQLAAMGKANVKTAVIDDAGYIMTHYFMAKHRDLKGNAQFEMYNEIADKMYNLLSKIKNELPDDVIVYIIMHEDVNDFGGTSLKTLGRLLEQKVCLEGMVTICLRCMSIDGKHYFRTTTDGRDITKAPEDMFPDAEMENDLKAVDTAIREYYEF